jgi:hypothetical protein
LAVRPAIFLSRAGISEPRGRCRVVWNLANLIQSHDEIPQEPARGCAMSEHRIPILIACVAFAELLWVIMLKA